MDDKVRIKIKLSAWSNISYSKTVTVEIDRDEWDDMDKAARDEFIDEQTREAIDHDIDATVEVDA